MNVTDSILRGNSSEGAGGGIRAGGVVTVTRSTLSGNSAQSGGGGLALPFGGMVTVTESTLSANSAGFGGGLANYPNGEMTVLGCTLAGNHTSGTGGGIIQIGGPFTVRNTLVAGNSAGVSPDLNGTLISQGHNLIGDGTGGSGFAGTDLVGTASNPIDPLLGPLANNGGPTPTRALLQGSPALDAGDNSGAPDTDQRGFPRIVNGASTSVPSKTSQPARPRT